MKAGHEPVMCHCGKGGQCHSALGEKTCCQKAEMIFPLFTALVSPHRECSQICAPEHKRDMTYISPVRGHEIIETGVSLI